MSLFGDNLGMLESRIRKNSSVTKEVFPEECNLIEVGLALMWDFTAITREATDMAKPNVYANRNLFGRNRQLLFNAYFCFLSSCYGTEYVLLRTVLENNNLMRLFNSNPQYAFQWLPAEIQSSFPSQTQEKYKGCNEKKFQPFAVLKQVQNEEKQKRVRDAIGKIYGQLCDYTHPNSSGWQEIMAVQRDEEFLLDLPTISGENADEAMKMLLWLFQFTLRTFVDTYGIDCLLQYSNRWNWWKVTFDRLITKYVSA